MVLDIYVPTFTMERRGEERRVSTSREDNIVKCSDERWEEE